MSNGAKPVIGKYDLVPFMKQEFPDSSFVKEKLIMIYTKLGRHIITLTIQVLYLMKTHI